MNVLDYIYLCVLDHVKCRGLRMTSSIFDTYLTLTKYHGV